MNFTNVTEKDLLEFDRLAVATLNTLNSQLETVTLIRKSPNQQLRAVVVAENGAGDLPMLRDFGNGAYNFSGRIDTTHIYPTPKLAQHVANSIYRKTARKVYVMTLGEVTDKLFASLPERIEGQQAIRDAIRKELEVRNA